MLQFKEGQFSAQAGFDQAARSAECPPRVETQEGGLDVAPNEFTLVDEAIAAVRRTMGAAVRFGGDTSDLCRRLVRLCGVRLALERGDRAAAAAELAAALMNPDDDE